MTKSKDSEASSDPENSKKQKEDWVGWASDVAGMLAEEASGLGIGRRALEKIKSRIAREFTERIDHLETLVEQLIKTNHSAAKSLDHLNSLLDEKNSQIESLQMRIDELEAAAKRNE